MRKALVVLLGAGAGAALWARRRPARERVDLYFEDGSMISLDETREEADRLLPLAHDVLAVARRPA